MARPRRDPVEALQSSLYCRLISIRLNIPLSGPEFSYFFEGSRRSSSKWQRIIDGSKTPSLGSRNQIAARILRLPEGESFCQELRDFWDSPLWQAMASKPPSGNDWSAFYKRLPLALQRHVFTTKASTANPFERRFPRKAEVEAVEKQCEMSTLAFIMALTREVTFPRPSEYGIALELSLCRMLIAFFQHEPFHSCWQEIWHYAQQHIISADRSVARLFHRTIWEVSDEVIKHEVSTDTAILETFRNIGWVSTELDERQLLLLIQRNPFRQVVTELGAFLNHVPGNYPTLNQLVQQLNKLRQKKHHIVLPLH